MQHSIFALSTAVGRAALAVFRLSGPQALPCLLGLIGKDKPIAARRAALVALYDPFALDTADDERGQGRDQESAAEPCLIDQALVFYFPGPASFTGEDLVEVHCHGSPAVIDKLNQVFGRWPGLRPAQAGEFTRRAFDAGKMDLLEVEGLGDLLAAKTEAQRRQAMGLAAGDLSRLYLGWRDDLIALLAHQEALIDFPDEDLPDEIEATGRLKVQTLLDDLRREVASSRLKQSIRDGIKVVLSGAPNAGKSSLLNHLARRDAAIVTEIPGTTRDLIQVELDLSGFPLILTDTAGIRATEDQVEQMGVARATQAAEEADVLIEVQDLSTPTVLGHVTTSRQPDLFVGTKLDLLDQTARSHAIPVSLKTGEGLENFERALINLLKHKFAQIVENPSHTRARHQFELQECLLALEEAQDQFLPELAAESLRRALGALDRLLGKSDVESILDVLFSDFCIGK